MASNQLFGWYVTGVSGFVHGLLYNDEVCTDTEVSAAKIVLAQAVLRAGKYPHQLLLTPTSLANRARAFATRISSLNLTSQESLRYNEIIWIPFEDYLAAGRIDSNTFQLAYQRKGIPNANKFLEYVLRKHMGIHADTVYIAVCIALMSVHINRLVAANQIERAYKCLWGE